MWMDRYLVVNLIKAKAYEMVVRHLCRVLDDATRSSDLNHRKWLIEHLCRAYIGAENCDSAKNVLATLSKYPGTERLVEELQVQVKRVCTRKAFGA